ncbi:MAG: DEAD/DEAH box helicase [Alphaproteobacteria bacterium]|nr:DEAD/DEAH box helicase [Alphaproteobacteria bacterium]
MTLFTDLRLAEPLTRALAADGYETPTPIQLQAIPPLLEGRDLLGIAQTGTGKTAAFALPILHRLAAERRRPAPRTCRVLVLAPTRELALQIAESFGRYGRFLPLRVTCVFGGVGERPQIRALQPGVDILVATPGRLLDLIGQGAVALSNLETFVLDEADRMLDMGFIHDVRRIVRLLPAARQTALLSATMPADIASLARDLLHTPVKVAVTPPATTVERVTQQVMFVDTAKKRELLIHLLGDQNIRRALVFTRTKSNANKVCEALERAGISASAIHGNKSQGARQTALSLFKGGKLRVLVATDIAARGIDIDDVTHVFNFDLPNEPESYVHRIGRTARAGRHGVAWSLVTPDQGELLTDTEIYINKEIPKMDYNDFVPSERPPGWRDAGERRDQGLQLANAPAPGEEAPPAAAPVNRIAAAVNPEIPAAADPSKFPGGLVPTKLPPRRMFGRIPTGRGR